jgi:hypothetical protein
VALIREVGSESGGPNRSGLAIVTERAGIDAIERFAAKTIAGEKAPYTMPISPQDQQAMLEGYKDGADINAILELRPSIWRWALESILATVEGPAEAAEFSKFLYRLLESALHRINSHSQRTALEPLVGLASLARSWGLLNSLSRADLGEVTGIVDRLIRDYPSDESYVLGSTFAEMTLRMRDDVAGDLGRLESLTPIAYKCRPVVSGRLYEEIAKQRLKASRPRMDRISDDLWRAYQQFTRDPKLLGNVVGLVDVYGRAAWLVGPGPKQAASLMQNVGAYIETSELARPDLLQRALCYEGMMRLSMGELDAGAKVLGRAYRLATTVGHGYFADLSVHAARDYHVDILDPDGGYGL